MDAHGIDYDAREYFKEPFTQDELRTVIERAGLSASELIATRSAPYHKERLAEQQLSDDELLEKMLHEPRLVRRPILVTDDEVIVGLDRDRYEALATRLAP